MASLLRVENLDISYATSQGSVPAVRHASFSIGEGEVVGVLGESGSGKSTLALSLARMLPANARCESGTIIFRGKNLLRLSEKQITTIRGAEIAIIWQDPALALNRCAFEPRCRERMKVCAASPPLPSTPEANRQVSCFKYE